MSAIIAMRMYIKQNTLCIVTAFNHIKKHIFVSFMLNTIYITFPEKGLCGAVTKDKRARDIIAVCVYVHMNSKIALHCTQNCIPFGRMFNNCRCDAKYRINSYE